MQCSQYPNFPPRFPSFKSHRDSIDHSRFKPNLTLPVLPSAPVWASLPTPPMSGSPPPEHPPSPQQIAGRRRKRSESLPPITTAPSSLPTTLSRGPSTYGPITPSEPPASYQQHQPQQPPPPQYTAPYSGPPQSMAYAVGPIAAPLPSPTDFRYPVGQTSPTTARKNKAHVASACINCKKKHLRCDNARPCRRCVQSGKEDTCQDVVHKKRGRPPLRPEDPNSRRSFDASILSDMARRMPTTDPASYAQTGQYGRSFRPLQAQPSYDTSRSHFRPGQGYSLYAAPSIGPSAATASGQFVSARGYAQGQHMPPQTPSPYGAPQSSRPLAPYPQPAYAYPTAPDSMRPPPTSQLYSSTPLFPRNQLPPPPDPATHPAGQQASLQLPPIRPAMPSIDPALSQPEQPHYLPPQQHQQTYQPHQQPYEQQQQQQQQQQQPQQPQTQLYPPQDLNQGGQRTGSGNGTTRQPEPKRPKMDIQGILGPKHD